MSKKVRSVRVPKEFETLNLSGMIRECEKHLRDIESATLLKQQGNPDAAEALIKARQQDLGRKVGKLVWEARVQFGKTRGD
ncbi:hypothetical protein SYK_21340 [Pseudodesulfovibrio nedwellii]|uniref:Uncharacterized protein n=1 Tax=Pseudodesulfovibrio nedwellii TaxID=2973072 RepID=A0ABM8B1S5_9BACT|nr:MULTISPECIES: hypothetical protein [Pseudodesulfovibrio]BDQ37774.1 hypothetical protein SYK_21340 [Pseudodesulfovibrio nedwellii]